MKRNLKDFTEKSLKSFLKKKRIGYTISLLTSFLITGMIVHGASIESSEQVIQSQESFIAKIQAQKSEIMLLLEENESRLKQLKMDRLSLINEGDWYSKSWYPSLFAELGLYWKKADGQSKKWVNSNRMDTINDIWRREYSGASQTQYSGSGWIMNTEQWNSYAQVYDNIAKITIIPTTSSPEVQTPKAPSVSFDVPKMPASITPPNLDSIPSVDVSVSVTQPSVLIPSVTVPQLTPITINVSEQNINVGTISLNISPAIPTFSINPTTPSLTLNIPEPASVVVPKPAVPDVEVVPTEPNASPFSDFAFASSGGVVNRYEDGYLGNGDPNGGTYNTDDSGINYYVFFSGYDPTTKQYVTYDGHMPNETSGGNNFISNTIRHSNTIYMRNNYYYNNSWGNGWYIKGIRIYVAGNVAPSSGINNVGGDGQIAIHTVWDGTLEDVTGYLFGQSAFVSIETWHGGKITLKNVEVNIENEDNTIFYIYPTTIKNIHLDNNDFRACIQRGGFDGYLDANITSNRNNVYVQSGASGSFEIKSTGTYKLEGSNNTIYSGLGYSANFANLKAGGGLPAWSNINEIKPSIQLITPVESYGDQNVVLFFNTKMSTIPDIWQNNNNDDNILDSAAFIGIYQGQLQINAKIGEYLTINNDTQQTSSGNKDGELDEGNSKYVEGNIGIYAKSGQRTGIDPIKHLGIPTGMTFYNNDPIHSLEVASLDVRFGKYSKDGIMIASALGTAIDVAKPGIDISELVDENNNFLTTVTTKIEDGIDINNDGKVLSSHNDSTNEAATGTIIAYAEGVWEQASHQLGSTTILSATDSSILPLEGKSSEINIYADVEM